MTITEAAGEVRELAKEHWWNGAGVVVVSFLIATSIWSKSENHYLLYAAIVVLATHCYVSVTCFERARRQRRYRQQIAVAYREQLKRENTQEPHHEPAPHQPAAGRRRVAPGRVAERSHLSLAR